MKGKGKGKFGILVLMCLFTLVTAVPAEAANVTMQIENRTSGTAYYLYVSPVTDDSWGTDLLGDHVLPSGQSMSLNVPVNVRYDVMIMDKDGIAYTYRMERTYSNNFRVWLEDSYRDDYYSVSPSARVADTGAVSRAAASQVWEKISAAAGLTHAPLQFDPAPEINAYVKFESSSRYSVHVTQGMMNALENADQLAGILGHEAAHITKGHYSKSFGQNLGIGLAAELVGLSDNALLQVLGIGGLLLAQSGFSREQEVEADDAGAQIAHKAGYDAFGLHDAFVLMRNKGVVTQPSGFNSHPPTERRLERLQYQATALASGGVNTSNRQTLEPEEPLSQERTTIAPQPADNDDLEARFQALVESMQEK